jgi:hypothetical protein
VTVWMIYNFYLKHALEDADRDVGVGNTEFLDIPEVAIPVSRRNTLTRIPRWSQHVHAWGGVNNTEVQAQTTRVACDGRHHGHYL